MLSTTREIVEYLIPKYASGRTLDVGAGSAKYRRFITTHVPQYETLDMKKDAGVDHVGDAHQMPFADGSYDTVITFQTLEHVRSASQVVSEIHRVLRDDGTVIATMPFLIPQHADPDDFRRFTKTGARQLFEDAGFTVLECDGYGGLFIVIEEMFKFLFLDPYKSGHGKVRRKIVHTLARWFHALDHRFQPLANNDFYANVFVVAKK